MRDQCFTAPSSAMRFPRAILAALAAVLTLGMSSYGQGTPTKYVSFDAPKAGAGANQGTFPSAINGNGWTVGTVIYSTGFSHGFLRKPNGSFIAIDPPTATQTFVAAVNASGESVGSFYTSTGSTSYGFLRDASGKYTTLAAPGAYMTNPSGINDSGVVSGFAAFTGGLMHSFFWDAQHGFTLFDVPGAAPNTTLATAINNIGTIIGTYGGADFFTHDFVRSRSGHFSTFEAVSGGTSTRMNAINNSGQTTGWGNDGNGGTDGFLGNSFGSVSLFNIDQGTDGTAISDAGIIVGYGFSDGGGNVPFERQTDGTVTILTLPFTNTGASATGVNLAGDVIGNYTDSAGANNGWIGIP